VALGKFDKKPRKSEGRTPHNFRRSCARNLTLAGVDLRTAMTITGHKMERIFERYNIKNNEDVKRALIQVGQHKSATVTPIAQTCNAR
jgi:integrase